MPYNPNSIWDSTEKKSDSSRKPVSEELLKPDKPSFFKRHGLLIFTIVLVAAIAGLCVVFYLLLPPAGPNVSITITNPQNVTVGNPFTLEVSFSNNSASVLRNASLSVVLPNDISIVGEPSSQRVAAQTVGDVGPGSINKQSFTLIATGNPQSIDQIKTALTYTTDTTGATQYETDGNASVAIGAAAVSLSFDGPANVFSGQNFSMTVNYANTTGQTLNGVVLGVAYPPAFTFKGASAAPADANNDSWNLGMLAPGQSGDFTITGQIVGPNNASYPFTGTITAGFSGITYPVNTQSSNITLAASPLSVAITLNNATSPIAQAGENLNYTLTYANNSNVAFQGVSIKTALLGSMFDFSTLQTNGSFDSRSNTVTWYAANTPALASLSPGESGSVSFTVSTKQTFPIRLPSDKNYSLQVNAQIASPTVPPNTAGSSTLSVALLQTKLRGQIGITSEGFWRDAASGIVNNGPYPPKVNQATEYTIHWDITNYSTDAQSVTVSAYLQSGTTPTGFATSTIASSTPTFDSSTGLVSWNIPLVPGTTGIVGPPIEAVFQVTNTPAVNEVNQDVPLIGPTTITGTDAFTGITLQATAQPVTTALPDDTTIKVANRGVTN